MPRSPSVARRAAAWLSVLTLSLMIATESQARTLDAGTWVLGGGIGPSFKTGSDLGMSSGYLMLNGIAEYVFMPNWSAVGSLALGLGGTIPARVRLGGRYRITGGTELPVSPYVQAELSAGRLYDVLGTNLTSLGVRVGGGADYFLSASWTVGLLAAYELARTTGDRPTSYGMIDVLITVGHPF